MPPFPFVVEIHFHGISSTRKYSGWWFICVNLFSYGIRHTKMWLAMKESGQIYCQCPYVGFKDGKRGNSACVGVMTRWMVHCVLPRACAWRYMVCFTGEWWYLVSSLTHIHSQSSTVDVSSQQVAFVTIYVSFLQYLHVCVSVLKGDVWVDRIRLLSASPADAYTKPLTLIPIMSHWRRCL